MASLADSRSSLLSRVLFLSETGEPMRFYLRPGAIKALLQPIIRAGGGVVCKTQEPKAILLMAPEDITEVPISTVHKYVSSQYILDCVEKSEQLEVDDYRFRNDSVQRRSVKRKREGIGRMGYSAEEDAAILKYVRGRKREVCGNTIWKQMEREAVTSHSWQSMKDRYRKSLAKQPLEGDTEGQQETGGIRGSPIKRFTVPSRQKDHAQSSHHIDLTPSPEEAQLQPSSEEKNINCSPEQTHPPRSADPTSPQLSSERARPQGSPKQIHPSPERARPQGSPKQIHPSPERARPQGSPKQIHPSPERARPQGSPKQIHPSPERARPQGSPKQIHPSPERARPQGSPKQIQPHPSTRRTHQQLPLDQMHAQPATEEESPPALSEQTHPVDVLDRGQPQLSSGAGQPHSLAGECSSVGKDLGGLDVTSTGTNGQLVVTEQVSEEQEQRPSPQKRLGWLEMAAKEFDESEDDTPDDTPDITLSSAAGADCNGLDKGIVAVTSPEIIMENDDDDDDDGDDANKDEADTQPEKSSEVQVVSPDEDEGPGVSVPAPKTSAPLTSKVHLFLFDRESQEEEASQPACDPPQPACDPPQPACDPPQPACDPPVTQAELEEARLQIRYLMKESGQGLESVSKALLKNSGDVQAALQYLRGDRRWYLWDPQDDDLLRSYGPSLRILEQKYGEAAVARRIAFLDIQ